MTWTEEECCNIDSCDEGVKHPYPEVGTMVTVPETVLLRLVSQTLNLEVPAGQYEVIDILHQSHEVMLDVQSFRVWADIEDDIELADSTRSLMNPTYSLGETMKNNRFKKTYKSTKNFVSRHRVGLAVTATAATALYVHVKIIDNVNDFLEAKGLLDEFYYLDEI